MGPYSHIILASKLEHYIKPGDHREYYWGAIAPDSRYIVNGMNRNHTHISPGEILNYVDQYPHLKPFLQGYLVHCVSDLIDLSKIIRSNFPFIWQKEELSSQQCTVILELLNILRIKSVRKSLSDKYNIVLSELGIGEEQAKRFALEMSCYLSSPSFVSLVALYQNLILINNGKLEKYNLTVQRLQQNWLRRNIIMLSLHVGRINEEITSMVKSILPEGVV